MSAEICGVCGGDGRIANSFSGSDARCPSCHGTGRRAESGGLRDVTKTKASHYQQKPNKAAPAQKEQGPSTFEGKQLAGEVSACAILSNDTKAKLTREIADHEATHGKCTQTFVKKVRRQLKPAAS